MADDKSLSSCPHCRRETHSGTHNGCYECGKVKHTGNGKVVAKVEEKPFESVEEQ